ncbi:uncharacterized protein LOC129566201 [Sitodiplosis mosellana]|uniref:uncharacterized protein LOC129566201 n=1 Tax=Sitodiplosis mosellana TaxID=263140 RepID=UPI002444198A|nr:uncharacterized protein LOC129566201 [Sitodiplosis mosellana]
MYVVNTYFDAVDKVWSGRNSDIVVDKHENLGTFLLENLNSHPELVTQINGDTGETLTKSEIRSRSIRCAQNLTKLGCTQDDRIGIVARNHHNLTPLFFGALCIGTPISPMDVRMDKDVIAKILERVRPSFIFCDTDVLESVKKIVNGNGISAKFFTVNGSDNGCDSIDSLINETGEEDSFVCSKIDDAFSHVAVIACSSGSTGFPKSISLSHALYSFVLKRQNSSEHTSLNFSSMNWVSGVFSKLNSALKRKHIFTKHPFSPDLFFDFVEKYKVQVFTALPYQMQAILTSERCKSADLSSLSMCCLAGNTVPPILVKTMKKVIPKCIVLTIYGMSETCGAVSCTMPTESEECPHSCGRLITGAKIKIINQETDEKCGIGEVGEICIKIPIPPMGYYKDEAATRNAYDNEGYFSSGDLGYFNETGRLYIIGRKIEIFRSREFDIWPGELENIILKHSAIRDVSVVNVYDDDIVLELPAAVVVKKEDSSITADDVYAIVADQLASYKRLDGGVYFVDELPMTPSGKTIRSKAKEIAQNFYQQRKLSQKS